MARHGDASTREPRAAPHGPPSKAAGLLLGLGLGGLVDGILMHQILQWHHLVSSYEDPDTMSGLELNTLADGFFHAASLFLVVGGVIVLVAHWRQGRIAPDWSYHWGLVVAGIGFFNIADSLVNHWGLGSHHVRDDLGGPLAWDIGFFVLSVILAAGGWLLHRKGVAAVSRRPSGRPT